MTDARFSWKTPDYIVINLPTAWSIISTIVMISWWGGMTFSSLQSAIINANLSLAEINSGVSDSDYELECLEKRVQSLEQAATRADAMLVSMSTSLSEVKALVSDITRLVEVRPSSGSRSNRD